MAKGLTYRAVHALAALAVCLQVMAPGALALAAPGADISAYLCSTPGVSLTAQEKQAAAEIARFVAKAKGEQAPEAPKGPFGDHCPLCALSHGVPLPTPVAVRAPAQSIQTAFAPAYELGHLVGCTGPPAGSRAPPRSI